MKRIIALLLIAALMITLAGCNKKNMEGKVYYLNFKPEQDAAWQDLADEYTEKTGVEVKVVTAAEGTYEQTLTAEIDKDVAPTLFQINGIVGLQSWKDYCMDLSGSKVYKELISDDFAIKEGARVYGVGYVYESYGLITNKKLLKKAGYEIEDITSFEKLKKVAEDITKRKSELGFSAFASSGLASSSAWRFSGHLVNLPLFYEFRDRMITEQPSTLKGTYNSNLKNIWDLYIRNSTVEPSLLTNEQNDAAEEFKKEKAVFYQNGTWEYNNVKAIGEENLGFLPIYFGVDDEKMGLCSGTENYWAVNNNASEADKMATLDFLAWVVTSEEGTETLAEDMGFTAPFKAAKTVDNKLSEIADKYVKEGKYSVTWAFSATPNVEAWRSAFVDALAAYSAGKGDWKAVENAIVNGWAEQYQQSKQ